VGVRGVVAYVNVVCGTPPTISCNNLGDIICSHRHPRPTEDMKRTCNQTLSLHPRGKKSHQDLDSRTRQILRCPDNRGAESPQTSGGPGYAPLPPHPAASLRLPEPGQEPLSAPHTAGGGPTKQIIVGCRSERL